MAATVENLREILFNVEPPVRLMDRDSEMPIVSPQSQTIMNNPTKENATKFTRALLDEMVPQADEVFPNLFIGNYKSILAVNFLRSKGITHVLNLGELDPLNVTPKVDPSSLPGIEYQKLDMSDFIKNSDDLIINTLKESAKIIETILKKEGSKLLVNCLAGISRSTSCVIAYLILKKKMTAQSALITVKKKRDVWPSNANLKFLAVLSNEIQGFQNEEEKDFGDAVIRIAVR